MAGPSPNRRATSVYQKAIYEQEIRRIARRLTYLDAASSPASHARLVAELAKTKRYLRDVNRFLEKDTE